MKTWVLVANAAGAKLLATDNLRVGSLVLMRELTHPESRKKTSELVSDRPGYYKTGVTTPSAYSKNDHKEVEAEHFALQLTHELKWGWEQHQFQRLIIITPVHFYGLLKKHLHLAFNMVEITYIPKDYTKYALLKLQVSLKEQLFS